MIRFVVRRQRSALLLASGLIVLLAAALVAHRWQVDALGREFGIEPRCLDPDIGACAGHARVFDDHVGAAALLRGALLVAPGLVGIVAGAGLFGRELERGTHVFALTQGVGRLRWWVAGLLVVGVPVAVAVGLVTVVGTWALRLDGGVVDPFGFEITGLVPVAYTLLAFAVAAAAGLVARSTLGAVMVTVGVQVTVQLVLVLAVREHYATPETARFAPGSVQEQLGGPDRVPATNWYLGSGYVKPTGLLVADGYLEAYTRYHPPARYWSFQLIESGLVLGLVAVALAAGLGGMRRRAL